MKYETLKQIVEMIDYLKSLTPESFEDVKEIVSVYNEGDDYCDFYYDSYDKDIVIEGCFCKNEEEGIHLSDTYTVLDAERNVIMEID